MSTNITRREFLKIGFAGGVLIASYPLLIERLLIMVNTYRIPVPGLPDAFQGFRILQLSDLHYGPGVPRWQIEHIVQTANRLKPDLIACTGDYVREDDSHLHMDNVWPVLVQLQARYGVFAVLGNHDHWADTARSLDWLKKSGFDLRHKAVPVEKEGSCIWVCGAGDLWEDDLGIEKAIQSVPPDACKVLLAHNPDTADQSFSSKPNLILSGHTHGGQVRIPLLGAPVVPVQNKRYTSGLFDTPNGPMFISRGTGWAILPIRFNCPPEIALLELVRAPEQMPDRAIIK